MVGLTGLNLTKLREESNLSHIRIYDSYKIWRPKQMQYLLDKEAKEKYNDIMVLFTLYRTYNSLYIEWWLHNIGYYITLPFCFIPWAKRINLRCKDVDFEERIVKD